MTDCVPNANLLEPTCASCTHSHLHRYSGKPDEPRNLQGSTQQVCIHPNVVQVCDHKLIGIDSAAMRAKNGPSNCGPDGAWWEAKP